MSTPENISALTSNSLSNSAKDRLSKITSINKTTILSKVDTISKKVTDLTKRENDVIEEYNRKFKELDNRSKKPPPQTQEEKQKDYDDLQKKKNEELLFIKNEIELLKKDISDTEINPLKDIKINLGKFKINNNKRIKKSKEERSKANKDRIKSVLANASKTLAPIVASLLTNQIISIVSNDAKLQELVDKTNEVIDAADTQEKLNQARVLRNSALSILNAQEKKVKLIQNIVKTLTTIEEYRNEDWYPEATVEQINHNIKVLERQIQIIRKGLCKVATYGHDKHLNFVYNNIPYIECEDFHDTFRVGNYPEDILLSYEDTMKFIEHKVFEGYSITLFENKFTGRIRLEEFWEKYPDGMIKFG